MRLIFLLFICLGKIYIVKGQSSLSIYSGVNKNLLSTNISNLDAINTFYTNGFQLGVGLIKDINKNFEYEISLLYITKNNTTSRNGFFEGVFAKSINSHVQLPLLIKQRTKLNDNISFNIGIGGFISYWLKSTKKASFPNILAPKEFDEEKIYTNIYQIISKNSVEEEYIFRHIDNRFQCGIALKFDTRFHINNNCGLLLSIDNLRSISDTQRQYQEYQIEKRNNTYSISAGILIKLNKQHD